MRIALLCLVACSSKAEPTLDLRVVVDGKQLQVAGAFLRPVSPDVDTIVLGGSCTDDGVLAFAVTKRVGPAGHERHFVTDVWSREHATEVALPAPVKHAGSTLELALRGVNFEVTGTITPTVCKAVTPTGLGAPKVTHASKGTITVAGKRLPIKGVTVSARTGVAATDLPNITISTNLRDCSAVELAAPVIAERREGVWTLRGTWLDKPVTGEAGTLAFTANAVGTSPDGPTLELQLSGEAKLGDYAVRLDGTAEAIECTR